ncbi:hypothetical protein REPUB_Repub18cG0157800 [Reevesia pubescens]
MEFKFRAVDYRRPNYFPHPPPSTFNPLSGPGYRPNPNFNQIRPNPTQWELEKAQIREQIIASDIARWRALQAEMRRELMAAWEIEARHRAYETGSSFEPRLTMRLAPRLPFMHHHFNNHNSWRPQAPFNLFPPPPTPPPPPMLPPPVTEIWNTEVKDIFEGNKNKLIILAKPDPNRIVGAKWKTPPPAGAGELPLPLISLKNKPDEEWSCAICQVSATNEKGLTEHLQGKKHKKKEARLKAERIEKNSNTTTLPKKLRQLDQKLEDKEKLKNTKDEQLIKREKKAESFRKKYADFLEMKHGPTAIDEVEITPEIITKKKYKFWCETCLVGAHSEVVMETHIKGKRHIARLMELDKNDAASPATTSTNTVTEQAGSDGTRMPKVTDVMADEVNEKLKDVPEADKYMFWCQLCSVGSHSKTVMETHKQGKRHIARLLDLDKNNAASPAPLPIQSLNRQRSDGTQVPKVTAVVADEAQ